MVKTKNKRRKEENAEDWCFTCKDGGSMRVCDYRGCLKAYHPRCVGKEDSFLENDSYWTCGSHSCNLCCKTSKFRCLCCPSAVCGECIYVAEFAVVKGNKGFCRHCSKLSFMIEEKADVDSDGGNVDFKDRETYEGLFSEYYEIIKKEGGLNAQDVYSAHNFFKNGKNKCDLDLDEIAQNEDDSGVSDDGSNFEVSDCDDLNDRAGVKSTRKKKKRTKKLKSIKGEVKDKKKDFIGWGSRSLIEFLEYTGRDTSRELSEYDVASIITEYCKENKLFDPQKKRKIICDQQLRSLLGRKSVNRNNIQNLLAPHFAENFEEMDDVMDDVTNSSEDRDDIEPFKISRQRKLISNTKSCQNLSGETQSCLAAIVSSNVKLVYLKRSLMEKLLKQPETFDVKVVGSFVRIKSDPNDFLQKNSHLLLQVVGIKSSSKTDENNKEILLQLSHVPKDVPICKISDDDFTEGECQDLYQRMRNGLLKQPTILELEKKARSLHEDILKHWIPRELALLQNRIDQANERGRRRELSEYMDRKLKLETPLEQARLLNSIPKVIPEIVDTNLSPEGSPREDELEQNGLPELAIGETCDSGGYYSKHSGFARCLNKTDVAGLPGIPSCAPSVFRTKTPVKNNHHKGTSESRPIQSSSKVRPDDQKATLFEELNCAAQIFNTASPHQSRNTESGFGVDAKNLSAATRNAKQTIKEKQIISVAETVETSVNDKQDRSISAIVVEKKVSISTVDVIELSDNDEQDVDVAYASARGKMAESPEISIWHCFGPYGERRGPYSMSVLKQWSESASHPSEFKVWKSGQSEKEAILLTDALSQKFPSM